MDRGSMNKDEDSTNTEPDDIIINEMGYSHMNQSSRSMGTTADDHHGPRKTSKADADMNCEATARAATAAEDSSDDQRVDDTLMREKGDSDVRTTAGEHDDDGGGEEEDVNKAGCGMNRKGTVQAVAMAEDTMRPPPDHQLKYQEVGDTLGKEGDGDKEVQTHENPNKSSTDNGIDRSVDTPPVQDAEVSLKAPHNHRSVTNPPTISTSNAAALSKYAAAGYALGVEDDLPDIATTRRRRYLSRMAVSMGSASASSRAASSTARTRSASSIPRVRSGSPKCTNVSNTLDGYASSGELSRDARVAAKIVQERMTLNLDACTSHTVARAPSTKKKAEPDTKDPPSGDNAQDESSNDEEKREITAHVAALPVTTSRRSQSERAVGGRDRTLMLGSRSMRSLQPLPLISRGVSDPGAVHMAGINATSATFREYDPNLSSGLSLPRPSTSGGFKSGALIEATLVQSLDFVEAQPVPMDPMDFSNTSLRSNMSRADAAILEQREKDRTLGAKILFGICTLLVVGLIVVVVMLTRGNNSSGNDDQSSEIPLESSSPLYPPFTLELSALTVEKITQNASSPQARANRWILEDPNWQHYGTPRTLHRFGLATLYYATGGGENGWIRDDHWLSYDTHECKWYSSHPGSICQEQFGALALGALNMSHNGLRGKIPLEIVYVDAKDTVDFSHNELEGRPPPMGRIARMKNLVVSNNGFEGPLGLKSGWANPSLQVLRLDGNRFNGTIPVVFSSGALPSLEELDLSSNQFTGPLPFIADAPPNSNPSLQLVNLANNQLTGTLPAGLAESWPSLQQFNVSGNLGITGTIPSEIGILQNLTLLDLRGTSLTGRVPDELCQNISQLEVLVDCDKVGCCLYP